jgi:rod shape-determining protein MreC
MENLISRYRNVTILVVVLFAQVLGLAVQVRRTTQDETRLIRVWAVDAVTPLEKGIVWFQRGISNLWHNYFYLRGVRQENRELKQQIEHLRIEQVRLSEDAEQARRLQALLGFKEQFISKTLAAQVIGSSGSEQSRVIYIDKGTRDGIKPDMAVITAEGVVGKVLRVSNKSTSQVLLINDQTSGVGAILDKSRLQGVLRGTPVGEVVLEKVMSDETVQPGERVLTSGGDQIFPKGLPVGTVTKVSPGPELFLNIRVKPTADLSRLEEVLVITQQEEKEPALAEGAQPIRAADILAQRLPSVPDHPPDDPNKPPPPTSGLKILPAPTTPGTPGAAGNPKPSGSNVAGQGHSTQSQPIQSQSIQDQGSTTTVPTAPKPRADAAGIVVKSGNSASPTIPPASKPATTPKPAAPALRIPNKATNAAPDSQSPPVSAKPDTQTRQPATEPAPPQEQPQ